jgi:hypothetical protein
MQTGKTRLVSRDNNGDPAEGAAYATGISPDGRIVTFYGPGDGLPGANEFNQVWIHNQLTGRTRLVSKANNGDPGDGDSNYGSLSTTGRFVAFRSDADNLPGGDGTNEFIYVRDMKNGRTFLASRSTGGEPASSSTYGPLISGDGRLAVFSSDDADLPAGDGSTLHTYLHNLNTRRTRIVDRNSSGEVAEASSGAPAISGNGRFVTFNTNATNLPGGDGSTQQVYRRDLMTEKTKLMSRSNSGSPAEGAGSNESRVSRNGRVVVFTSQSTNLPGGDGSTYQVYARDLDAGKTRLLSRAGNGDPGDDDSYYPSVAANGEWAAFDSVANNFGGDPDLDNMFRAGPIT